MKKLILVTGTIIMMLMLSATSHAELIDRGGGLIYETDLDITWLQDANHAQTSDYDDDGRMSWYNAMNWADQLEYGGYNDWRLPTALNPDGSGPDNGFNFAGSELGHLFYTELGNLAYEAPDGSWPQPGWGLSNTGPFVNVQAYDYWTSTEPNPNPNDDAYDFDFNSGKMAMSGMTAGRYV